MANRTSKQLRKNSRLWVSTVLNAFFLVVVFVSHQYIAEEHWLAMFLTYIPQLLFLVPVVVLLCCCCRRTTLAQLGVNAAALLLGLWFVAGLHWNPFVRATDRPRLRVMTYNVDGGHESYDGVAKLILAESPDVICLEEAGNMDDLGLTRQLRGYEVRHEGGIAIATRLPILGQSTIPLPPGQTALSVVVRHGDSTITVIACHLVPTNIQHDAFHGGAAITHSMERTARLHASQVRRLLEAVLPTPGKVLLCGDFNAPPYGIQYGRLSSYLTDAYAVSGSGFGYTVPAKFPFIRIDFIFCNDKLRPVAAWVPHDMSSDHRPVVSDIEWR